MRVFSFPSGYRYLITLFWLFDFAYLWQYYGNCVILSRTIILKQYSLEDGTPRRAIGGRSLISRQDRLGNPSSELAVKAALGMK